mgnify:CR=1 FL=1|jgi:hypothetical protein
MNKIILFIREYYLILFLLIGAFAFFYSGYIENKIKKMKVEAIATIYYSDKESYYRGGNVWRSRGIYYVNGRGYNYTIEAVIPIGTKFKVYYLPSNPQKSLLANPREFDNYPEWEDSP